MGNLLDQTVRMLSYNEKTPDDVIWVGSGNGQYSISWGEFVKNC